jgi:hypothetical protein
VKRANQRRAFNSFALIFISYAATVALSALMADNQVLAKSKTAIAKCWAWSNAICKFEKEKYSFNVTVALAAYGHGHC